MIGWYVCRFWIAAVVMLLLGVLCFIFVPYIPATSKTRYHELLFSLLVLIKQEPVLVQCMSQFMPCILPPSFLPTLIHSYNNNCKHHSFIHSLCVCVCVCVCVRVCVAAIIGGMNYASFSAFWTCLTFLLSDSPFNYSESIIGLFGLIGVAGALAAPAAGVIGIHHHTLISLTPYIHTHTPYTHHTNHNTPYTHR